MVYLDENSYLAAPKRKYLSLMTRAVLNADLLKLEESHLDYGCGYGKDVEILRKKGYNSTGYDRYYFPSVPEPADVVTCGYVLNVLSQRSDRFSVLTDCWKLTKKRLIIAAEAGRKTKHLFTLPELRATIEIAIKRRATRLGKGIFLVEKDSPSITTYTREEVIKAIAKINDEGWVAPIKAKIKGYCTGFDISPGMTDYPDFCLWPAYRYFRLSAKKPVLPGKDGKMVAHVHLGKTRDTEKYQWAVAGILRRNQILRMKFYCEDFSFIDEFADCRNWEFLDPEWKPNPDPLGQPDMSRKPARLANPNFVRIVGN